LTSIGSVLDVPPRLAPPALRTLTVRQSATALVWTLGLVGLFAIWWVVERDVLGLGKYERLVNGAALVPMVFLGVPHFLIGFLFLATSRRMRSWRSVALLGGLVALGAGLCVLYGTAGAESAANKLPVAAVTLYFIVHQLRDEAFFYRVSGDAPPDVGRDRTARFVDATTWVLVVVIGGLGVYAYDVHAHHKTPPREGPLDYVFPAEFGAAGRALAVAAVVLLLVRWRLARWARRETGGFLAAAGRHRPMAAVYGLLFLVVFTGAAIGSGALLASIVLWHVIEWLLFATRQAAQAEATRPAPTTWLGRAKGTRRGFLALHLGLAAVVFLLMVVWAYGGRSSVLTPVVSQNAFYYWTIMHVTVSFFPR
jgi:hypothetical protein